MSSPCLIVGEMNPYGTDVEFALYCYPVNSAGGRMQRLVAGLSEDTYLGLARTNLCIGAWSLKQARLAAGRITLNLDTPPVLVLLGKKVAEAFGYGTEAPFTAIAREPRLARPQDVVLLPHPSGLCRVWHEQPSSYQRARDLLKLIVPSVPWGEAS